jgi:hypothetical protein
MVSFKSSRAVVPAVGARTSELPQIPNGIPCIRLEKERRRTVGAVCHNALTDLPVQLYFAHVSHRGSCADLLSFVTAKNVVWPTPSGRCPFAYSDIRTRTREIWFF